MSQFDVSAFAKLWSRMLARKLWKEAVLQLDGSSAMATECACAPSNRCFSADGEEHSAQVPSHRWHPLLRFY